MEHISQQQQNGSPALPDLILMHSTLVPLRALSLEIYEQFFIEDPLDRKLGALRGRLLGSTNRHLPTCESLDPFEYEAHKHVLWLKGESQIRVGLLPGTWKEYRLCQHQQRSIDLLSDLFALRLWQAGDIVDYTRTSRPKRQQLDASLNHQYHLQLSYRVRSLFDQLPQPGQREQYDTEQSDDGQDLCSWEQDTLERFEQATPNKRRHELSFDQRLKRMEMRVCNDLRTNLQYDKDQDMSTLLSQEPLPTSTTFWDMLTRKKQDLTAYKEQLELIFEQIDTLDQIFILQTPSATEESSKEERRLRA
jgi:hypothetical protein